MQNTFFVLFATKGTIWGSVLPFCIYSAFAYILFMYVIPTYYRDDFLTNTALSSSSDSITLLVSFLVVMRYDAEFSTFVAATTEFYHILTDAEQVALHAVTFTSSDTSDKANEWRNELKKALVSFVHAAVQSIHDGDQVIRIFEGSILPGEPDPLKLAARVHDVIVKHHEHLLVDRLTIYHEMKLHEFVGRMLDEYVEVGKFIETPTPFPFVQVCRTILYFYLISLPLFISNEFSFPNVASVFFAAYGFFGLEIISDEIGDPFGDDCNDVEIMQAMKASIHHIRHILEGDVTQFVALVENEANGKGGNYFYDEGSSPQDLARIKLRGVSFRTPKKTAATSSRGVVSEKAVRPPRDVKDLDDLSVANDEAEDLRILGMDEMELFNLDRALDYFKMALRTVPQPSQAASILELMGDVYSLQGRHTKALERYQEALRLKRKTKMMKLLSKIADEFFLSGEYEKAISIYMQALPLKSIEDGWDSDGVAQMYHRVGLIYFDRGESDLALDHFWHALRAKKRRALGSDQGTYWGALHERVGTCDEEDLASVLFCMGLAHEERCEYEWAMASLGEALVVQGRHLGRDHADVANTLLHIGAVHARLGEVNEARATYTRARDMQRRLEEAERSNSVKDVNALETRGRRKESSWRAEAKKILEKKSYQFPDMFGLSMTSNEEKNEVVGEQDNNGYAGDTGGNQGEENMFKSWSVTA